MIQIPIKRFYFITTVTTSFQLVCCYSTPNKPVPPITKYENIACTNARARHDDAPSVPLPPSSRPPPSLPLPRNSKHRSSHTYIPIPPTPRRQSPDPTPVTHVSTVLSDLIDRKGKTRRCGRRGPRGDGARAAVPEVVNLLSKMNQV